MSDSENPFGTDFTPEELDQIGKGTWANEQPVDGAADPHELQLRLTAQTKMLSLVNGRLHEWNTRVERLESERTQLAEALSSLTKRIEALEGGAVPDPLSEEALGF